MDVAIVTGASSSLGLAISRRLIDLGFRVYGLGGNFSDIPLKNAAFVPMNCNLADPNEVEKAVRQIIEKERAVCLVVNNAKLYPPENLEEATTEQLERSLAVNLLCPLILVRETLAGLRRLQGQIVNIASATPETGRGGPAGAATAGGLRWLGEQLFQQVRETGVKVTTISPEPNRWRPVDLSPAAGQRPQSTIDPEVVAGCISDLVSARSGNVVTEIVLRPQRIVEKPQPPVRELPYPKPQPIPYTVPRAEIEAEELLDEEQEVARENLEFAAAAVAAQTEDPSESTPASGPPAERVGEKRRRRRRRRGDRGDRGERDRGGERAPAGSSEGDQPRRDANRGGPSDGRGDAAPERDRNTRPSDDRQRPERGQPPAREAAPADASRPTPAQGEEAAPSRRKRRRKPRPASLDLGRPDLSSIPRPKVDEGSGRIFGEAKPRPSDGPTSQRRARPQSSASPAPDARTSVQVTRPTEPARREAPPAAEAKPRAEDKVASPAPVKATKAVKAARKATKKVAAKAARKTPAKKATAAKKAPAKKAARKAAAKKSPAKKASSS